MNQFWSRRRNTLINIYSIHDQGLSEFCWSFNLSLEHLDTFYEDSQIEEILWKFPKNYARLSSPSPATVVIIDRILIQFIRSFSLMTESIDYGFIALTTQNISQ
jgi:hypothetical protein